MSALRVENSIIDGVLILSLPTFIDERGAFIKTFNSKSYKEYGIEFELRESYYSFSQKNVVRGMHFQIPPHQHSKIVYCPKGSIIDVIVDLRKKSPTYGKFVSIALNENNNKAVFIPEGCAHGFQSLEHDSMTYYLVSSEYHQESDTGILYNSFGMVWENEDEIIISQRDLSFPALSRFNSPF